MKTSRINRNSGRRPKPATGKRKLKPHGEWNHPARKPCGCRYGSCLKCRRADSQGSWSADEVRAMWADYSAGMSRSAVERKHGVGHKGLGAVFARRGYKLRPFRVVARQPNGAPVRQPRKTAAEIAMLIAAANRLVVPSALKNEWRRWWTEARKKTFVRQLRASLAMRGHKFAPTGRPSANVRPFDYFTPSARAIVSAANVGLTSQTKAMHLRPASQGLIFEGELWFWSFDNYQRQSHGHDERAGFRPCLHRYLFERFHGPIPAQHTVIHRDGNKNNLSPENLVLRSMADCARMNAWHQHPEKHPGLAKRIAVKSWLQRGRKMNAVARAQVGALLGGGDGIFEQLTRSKR